MNLNPAAQRLNADIHAIVHAIPKNNQAWHDALVAGIVEADLPSEEAD